MMNWLNTYRRYACDIHRINQEVRHNPEDLIQTVERIFHGDIQVIVDRILNLPVERHMVYLSGPSGSGKTTTGKKLAEAFEAKGCHAILVSMDDFYLGKDYIPLLPNGKRDFEAVEALNIPLVKECVRRIVQTGECTMPVYDFTASRRSDQQRTITAQKDSVVIMEGIHALNPVFDDTLPPEYVSKIYVAVKQGIKDNEDYVLTNREIRLLRRIMRDSRFRGTPPELVIERWEDVVLGERRNIRPYRYSSDFTLNSIHIYEPCLIKDAAIALLSAVRSSPEVEAVARHLVHALKRFESVREELVPTNSLIREFIGGGSYEY